ncbi:hypothetical protein [Nesterenkonia flava]|uniref:DUF3558 domain-containing protein n=1 Tax=Nesterenkonia flava TaxID=469799 RepID=A0ABU1FPZ0_9MICC|nr:hypothetical protein [Nesterenkonia flava]MDR5710712.1 hypothetical protein [Nesterenkonia flava]
MATPQTLIASIRTGVTVLGAAALVTALTGCAAGDAQDDAGPAESGPTGAEEHSSSASSSDPSAPEEVTQTELEESPEVQETDGASSTDAAEAHATTPDAGQVEGACALLSPDKLSEAVGEPLSAGQPDITESPFDTCLWSHPTNDQQGASLYVIADEQLPAEELFPQLAAEGEPVQVEGAVEASYDAARENIVVRGQQEVFQLYLYAFDAEEEDFVRLSEIIAANL